MAMGNLFEKIKANAICSKLCFFEYILGGISGTTQHIKIGFALLKRRITGAEYSKIKLQKHVQKLDFS